MTAGVSLGDDLRAIADLLATRAVDGSTTDAVTEHLAAARAVLEAAPPEPHAYTLDPTDRGVAVAHHDRFGPVRGLDNVVAPPLVFGAPVMRDGVSVVNAVARCGPRYEGPRGLVHGGILAACFDEVLAIAQRDAGFAGVTRELNVRYRKPVRIDEPLVFTAWIEQDDGRRALGRAACHVGDELRADAAAEFAKPR